MSLRVWLPLNGTLDNQGLDDIVVTNNGATVDNNGKIGKCYSFDGSDNRIYANNILLNNSAMSACCWVKLNSITNNNYPYIFALGSNTGGNGIQIGLAIWKSGSKLHLVGHGAEPASNYTPPLNSWIHLCITISGTSTKLYVNGILTDTKTNSNSPKTQNCLCIGARPNSTSGAGVSFSYPLDGYINDFRLYDHALSPMEIKQISQGLILHYPLNRNGWGQDNLCTGTIGEKAFTKNVNGDYCNPINVYPLGADARSLLQNSEVGDIFTCSFDYEVKNNQIEEYQMKFVLKTASNSFSTEGLEYVFQKGNALLLGDSSGHGEIAFKLKQSHKTYGTGWLLNVAPNKNTNTNIEVTIKNFKFEKGNKATPWRPHPSEITSDSFFNLNNNIEYDCSGYKNNGIKEGTFAYTSNTPKYNVSSIFNGTENIKRDTLEGEIYTLTCWAKTTKDKATSQIMVVDSKSQMAISFYKGQIIGVFGATRGTGSKSTLGDSYKENEWNHFAVVKTDTSGGRAIYCNGVLLTPASNDYWSPVAGFFVGTRNNSQGLPFYGEICDIRAYATALSAEDILSLYNNEAYIDNNGNIYGAVYEEG